jgi:hypothetical protein
LHRFFSDRALKGPLIPQRTFEFGALIGGAPKKRAMSMQYYAILSNIMQYIMHITYIRICSITQYSAILRNIRNIMQYTYNSILRNIMQYMQYYVILRNIAILHRFFSDRALSAHYPISAKFEFGALYRGGAKKNDAMSMQYTHSMQYYAYYAILRILRSIMHYYAILAY